MDDIETIIEALHGLYASLETLRSVEGPELLLPGKIESCRSTLEDASTAYAKIETAVDEWGQELEYQHLRLDEGVKKYGE